MSDAPDLSKTGYMINGFNPEHRDRLDPDMQRMVQRRAELLGPAYKLFYEDPLHIVRGDGVFLYDAAGREYLDVYNNVPVVGHSHPRVAEAVSRQLRTLNTHTRYAQQPLLDYSERFLATFPDAIDNVMYTCTGSEAADLAIRMAREVTGRRGVIVTEYAYHGTTASVVEFSPTMGPNVPIGLDVRTVPAPIASYEGEDVGATFAANVRRAIADLERHGSGFAALIVDTIFSTDGVLPDPVGFLAPAVEAVHEAGGLFIADEVQPGFARTGTGMWGFQRHGIVPDMAVMGKPMGNGMPIAALAARSELVRRFGERIRYFNTFAAGSACIAAATAVLDVIEDEQLMQNAERVGFYMFEGLASICSEQETLSTPRGAGLFLSLDFVSDEGAPDAARALSVVNELRQRGVLIGATGPAANGLKIRPPLPFTIEHADRFLETFGSTVRDIR